MPESISRINEVASKYSLVEWEARLLADQYQQLLFGNGELAEPSLLKLANASRKIASMWNDLDEEDRCSVPDSTNTPICFAARAMYLAGQLLSGTELKTHWYREASIAYLQSGNLPASHTAWKCYRSLSGTTVESDWPILVLLGLVESSSERLISITPDCLREPWEKRGPQEYLDAQKQFYELASDEDFSPYFEKGLCYRLARIIPLLGRMSVQSVLNSESRTLPPWYWEGLRRTNRMLLLPSQVKALSTWLSSQGNCVLCTPTSTGKSFVAELAITMQLIESEGICIFVTPYKAVARTIYNAMRSRLGGSEIELVKAYGDTPVSVTGKRVIMVGTPEKVDSWLVNNSQELQRVEVVVFDEIHLISQRGRGAFYEALISRMLLEQATGSRPARLLGISAVVNNISLLVDWFQAGSWASSDWRPNPIIESYWSLEDDLYLRDPSSPRNDSDYLKFTEFGPTFSDWPSPRVKPERMQNLLRKPLGERCGWFVKTWNEGTGGTILVICSSRSQTREFASVAAGELSDTTDPELNSAAQDIEIRFPYLSLLGHCIRRGIAYHNAALPTQARNRIEDLLQENRLRAVFATTTLAEGADFPFRSVVIAAPSLYDAESARNSAMSPLLLRNIAGRGGRTSGQLLGDVVQMYSPQEMYDHDGQWISSDAIFEKHLVDSQNCNVGSSIDSNLSPDRNDQARSQLFSAFDKAIFRWDDREETLSEYRQCFLSQRMKGAAGVELASKYESAMTSTEEFGEPLASRASPLHLTELGEIVMQSGFSIYSARTIWALLQEKGWFGKVAGTTSIVAACSELGGKILEVHELRASNRRPLQESSLPRVYEILANGGSLSEAYLAAEGVVSSLSTQRKAEKLVEGKATVGDSAHGRFEAFSDDLKRVLLLELPSIAKAMRDFIRYKNPSIDTAGFERVLENTEKLRRVIN